MDKFYFILVVIGVILGILERALNVFGKVKNLTKNKKDGQPPSM